MALQKITANSEKINNIKKVYNTRKVNTGTSENTTYKYDVQLPATDADQVYYKCDINDTTWHNDLTFGSNVDWNLSLKTVIDNIIKQIGVKSSEISQALIIKDYADFNTHDTTAKIKWLYDNRLSIDDIGTFWKYIGEVNAITAIVDDSTNLTKTMHRLDVAMSFITLSNGTQIAWSDLKEGSVIHTKDTSSEYVLFKIEVNISTNQQIYYWTEFGPDLSGYAKTSDVNPKISDLNTKVNTNTTNITANSTVINNIIEGRTYVEVAKSLIEDRTLELNINNGTNTGSSASITLPLGKPADGDDYDASVSASATLTLPDSGVTAGPYSCVSVNAKGIVTSGQQFIAYATNLSGISNLAVGGLAIVDSLE